MPADIGDADSQDPPDGGRALPELALAILGIGQEALHSKHVPEAERLPGWVVRSPSWQLTRAPVDRRFPIGCL